MSYHCIDGEKKSVTDHSIQQNGDRLILIGPEGDFTKDEVDAALQNNFIPVSLGENRLRTQKLPGSNWPVLLTLFADFYFFKILNHHTNQQ